jgi:anti-sigma B factor antagonist
MALDVNTTVKSPGIFIIAPIGSIDGTDHGMLQEKIDSVLKLNPDVIMFDLEHTDYINSLGIRVLVKTKNAMKQRGGSIAFINLQPQIKKVFAILNAMPAFKVFATIQEFDDYLWAELKKMDAKVKDK